MVARSSPDAHSWSNHIPSSAGDIQGGCFLRPLPLFSFLSLFSPRLFPTWLAPLPRVSSLRQYVWPLLHSCTRACIGKPLSWSRYDRGLNTNYAPVRLFCGFARYRSYRKALLYCARISSLPYYISCIFGIIPNVTYYFVSILLFPYD